MKKLPKLFAFICLSLAVLACKGNKNEDAKDPCGDFATWVSAYTGGLVPGSATIKVEFASTPDNSVPASDLLKFSPSIKGEARWAGSRMLEFIPDEDALKQDKEYKAKLRLDKIFTIEDPSLRTFEFTFKVAPKKAELVIDNVRTDLTSATVNGRLTLSEDLAEEKVKSYLYLEGDAAGAEITLTKVLDGVYDFSCGPLERKSSDGKLTVVFDGHEEKYEKTVSASVTIPSSTGFCVFSAKKVEGTEPYIEVVLSQPLDPLADISGMFTLTGCGKNYATFDGNIVKVFYERLSSACEMELTVSALLKDCQGVRLGENWNAVFHNDEPAPEVKLLCSGNILPDENRLILPFQAVNLRAVDLRVIKIYRNNVLSFLQDNDLNGSYQLRRSARLVYKKTLLLDTDSRKDLHQWNTFCADLSSLMKRDEGAIYRVTLSFKQDYSLYGQGEGTSATSTPEATLTKLSDGQMSEGEQAVWDEPETFYYEDYIDWSIYDWQDRDNPLTPSYYMVSERFPSVNLISSNLGIVVKQSNGNKLDVWVNDIISSAPLQDAEITVYNFQLQSIAKSKTDASGHASITPDGKAFVVKATQGKSSSYLKVTDSDVNSLSKFDVGGDKVQKGIKGFLYGERGVWRPGDVMHLVLICSGDIPANHPAVLELHTPKGQLYSRVVCSKSVNGFYTFDVKTSENDETGTYSACAKVGGATFYKSLPIETIKPNRLKINLNIPSSGLRAGSKAELELSSCWLTGPAASSLKAKATVTLKTGSTSIEGYPGYVFNNPLAEFTSSESELFSTRLDAHGKATVSAAVPAVKDAPGILKAVVATRVVEPGGDESIVSQTVRCLPYDAYVGVKVPSDDDDYLETDKTHTFRVCLVDANGKRVTGHRLEYRIYRLDWSWWWEKGGESLANYINGHSERLYTSGQVISSGSDNTIDFKLNYPDWGRFLIYVHDRDGGHTSGSIFFCDWPLWRGRADRGDGSSATMLTFSLDKKSYTVGEQGVIYIPAAKGARALVTFENDSRVLSSAWVETSEENQTQFRFTVTKDMAPNCYACITLLNPHSRTADAQPLRLYGVQPVTVTNPSTHLEPQLALPSVIRPQEEFTVKVSEKSSKPMTYTLAIVDEGLLDLTSFKTPDPWKAFNRRTALGVKTWDIYDNVINAFGSTYPSMFSIGGDEDTKVDGTPRDNRFNPVVEFMGPFTLKKGTATHKITLPMYVGSVRVMVVAAQDGAYGSVGQDVPVRSPLMVLPTLPRKVSVGEKVTMPVNVFSMEEDVKDVEVSVSVEGALSIEGGCAKTIKFTSPGDQLVSFSLRSSSSIGSAKVKVTAKSGNYSAQETVNLEVTNSNPAVSSYHQAMLEAGESCTFPCEELSADGDYNMLEVSSLPSIDVNGVWLYVKYYPHLCTEQLSARGITLLSILPQLDESRKEEARQMITQILSELSSRQLSDGNFAYWQGTDYVNQWADAMAGHFMALAANNGFNVNGGVFGAWRNKVKNFVGARHTMGNATDDLAAYDLYVLALSGNSQDGAMNRLKESDKAPVTARYLLSSAYSLSGKKTVAQSILSSIKPKDASKVTDDSQMYFSSSLRNKAIALEAQALCGNLSSSLSLAKDVAEGFAKENYTTQTTAFASVALSRLSPLVDKSALSFRLESGFGKEGANSENVKTANTSWSRTLSKEVGSVKVTNTSSGVVYVGLVSRVTASCGTAVEAASSGISLSTVYEDLDGNSVNPSSLPQGSDFTLKVTVKNPDRNRDCRDLALRVGVPSGWEIFNSRLFSDGGTETDSKYSYCDIRDSEVLYYFNLPAGSTKNFSVRLSATYLGEFALPSISCEAMYDNTIFARTASGTAVVK